MASGLTVSLSVVTRRMVFCFVQRTIRRSGRILSGEIAKKSGKGSEGEWVLRQEECLAAVQADPGIAGHYGAAFVQGVPEDVEIARQERLPREELVDIGPYGAPRFNISAAGP